MRASLRGMRSAPWATAAAGYAWGAAIVLTVLLEPGTLAVVAPPALVASVPLVVPGRRQALAGVVAAMALAAWAVVGIALLGLYFLPAAALLLMAYFQARSRHLHRC